MKIVINSCYGGFSISKKAIEYMAEKGNETAIRARETFNKLDEKYDTSYHVMSSYKDRTNSLLIETVEALGKEANGKYAELKIVEIPDDVDWEITEYDGWETVEEKHRSWS